MIEALPPALQTLLEAARAEAGEQGLFLIRAGTFEAQCEARWLERCKRKVNTLDQL